MRDILIVFPDNRPFRLASTKSGYIVEHWTLDMKVLRGTWLKLGHHSMEVKNYGEAHKIWREILKAAERGDEVFRVIGGVDLWQ